MNQAQNGPYIAAADYEKLATEFQCVVDSVAEYFRKIEAGEMTAADAETVFKVRLKILS